MFPTSKHKHINGFSGQAGGFTFIELLVGVSIGALLLTALYATFFTVTRATGTVETSLGVRMETGRLLDRLGGEVRGATFEKDSALKYFAGAQKGMNSELVFTTWSRPPRVVSDAGAASLVPVSDLLAVRYVAEQTDGALSLVREAWSPYTGERTSVVAIEEIESFEVSFYDGSNWTKAWDAGTIGKLPVAVKATVVMPDGERASAMARVMLRGD